MMSRRMLLFGLPVASLGMHIRPPIVHAAPKLAVQGCCLRKDEAGTAASRVTRSLHATATKTEVMPSSGNPDLDRYLGKALERLADSFKIYPGFAFVDDSGSPNAYAMRETLRSEERRVGKEC